MATSQSDNADKRPASKNTGGRADTSQDEIDLSDYFRVLWRRKYFVVFGAVCPALLVWLIYFLSPNDYRVTYTYDIGPDARTCGALLGGFQEKDSPNVSADKAEKAVLLEKDRRILLDRFYSVENLDKLAAKLRENGFEEYARDISQTKIQLNVSDDSLAVTITGGQTQDVQKISSIVRDNLEKVIPIYSVVEHLSGDVARLRTAMASIEENKFGLELELERKKAISARLKTLESTDSGMALDGLVLHFESIGENSEYLPLPYQVRATDANVVNIEQTIRANQEKYDYYGAMLSLHERLLEEVRNKMSSYYTIGEFHSFLVRIMGDYEGSDVRNYLSAYIKKIENATSANTPVIETHRISSVPKGGLRKVGIVFVGLLMMTTFGAFLLDAAQKDQKPGAVKSS